MKVKSQKSLDEIKEIIISHIAEIRKRYYIRRIGIFGSVVRGEATENSDVDILVEFSRPVGFFEFLELEEFLEKLIGRKVDLVSRKALKPYIGGHILEEVITIWEESTKTT